jgi:hypothetical protein
MKRILVIALLVAWIALVIHQMSGKGKTIVAKYSTHLNGTEQYFLIAGDSTATKVDKVMFDKTEINNVVKGHWQKASF